MVDSSLVAFDVSVVFVVVERLGCALATRLCEFSAKVPPDCKDSAARLSDKTVPGSSFFGFDCVAGSVVTWIR